MAKFLTILLAALAVGCAGGDTKEASVLEQNDAIDDFIKVAELPATDDIRTGTQVHHTRITDHYIILHDSKKYWLTKYRRKCHELRDTGQVTPDVRHQRNLIRARFDTYRGCRIDKIYEVSEGQAEELIELGNSW